MATAVTTKKTTPSTLPKSVFAVEVPNHQLLQLAYEAYLANGRPNLAKTLTRGLVRGGGKKPWRQKGTGRARFGSSRNPIWRKGGIVFGPLGIENYRKRLSTTAKRVALRQALTLAARDHEIVVVDAIKVTGKTKEMVQFLSSYGLADKKQIVIAVDSKTPELVRATNNLPNVTLMQATYLNVFSILNADKLIITKAGMATIETWLGETK